MEQDLQPSDAAPPATEPQPTSEGQEATSEGQPPAAEDPAPQPESGESAPPAAAAASVPAGPDSPPDSEQQLAPVEEPLPLPPPPPAEPVPVIELNRTEIVNSVLAGRRAVTGFSRPPARLQLPLPREGFTCGQCGER